MKCPKCQRGNTPTRHYCEGCGYDLWIEPGRRSEEDSRAALPKVWPEVPWPKDVWLTTVEEADKLLRAKLGDNDTTAISGTLMRHGWQCAEQAFKTLLEENGFSAPNVPVSHSEVATGAVIRGEET